MLRDPCLLCSREGGVCYAEDFALCFSFTRQIDVHGCGSIDTPNSGASVAGKVTSIGDGGHSFAVEANEGDTEHTIQFVVNDSTQVKGKVTVGTAVTVEYQAMESGENLARSVTAQG